MDRSWIRLPTQTSQYQQGLAEFLDFAFQHTSSVSKIICPCKNCKFKKWQTRSVVWDHLTCTPFPQGYTFWYRHGEKNDEETSDRLCETSRTITLEDTELMDEDPMRDMVHEAFGNFGANTSDKNFGSNESMNAETIIL